jgi:hypothetical protein
MRLDRRLNLDGDPELVRHAKACDDCNKQLETWQSIESVIVPAVDSPTNTHLEPVARGSLYPALAVAALLLIVFGVTESNSYDVPDQVALTEMTESTGDSSGPADIQANLDALEWWASVRDRDWLAQTMPAVRSVQQGVAPLGRSLIQAVTILTVGDPGQTS